MWTLATLWILMFPALPDPEPDSRGKGYVGVTLEENEGLRITKVLPNTPASRAGLQEGDVILRINNHEPENLSDAIRNIGYNRPGNVVPIEIRRGDDVLKLKIKVTIRPSDAGPIPVPIPTTPLP